MHACMSQPSTIGNSQVDAATFFFAKPHFLFYISILAWQRVISFKMAGVIGLDNQSIDTFKMAGVIQLNDRCVRGSTSTSCVLCGP